VQHRCKVSKVKNRVQTIGKLASAAMNKTPGTKTRFPEDEELMRKFDSLMKDPAKWKEYIESRAEKAIRHWPKR
jgi:hypothetical protein